MNVVLIYNDKQEPGTNTGFFVLNRVGCHNTKR